MCQFKCWLPTQLPQVLQRLSQYSSSLPPRNLLKLEALAPSGKKYHCGWMQARGETIRCTVVHMSQTRLESEGIHVALKYTHRPQSYDMAAPLQSKYLSYNFSHPGVDGILFSKEPKYIPDISHALSTPGWLHMAR